MSTVLSTLKALQGEADDIDFQLVEECVVLWQHGDMVILDRRQRQELAKTLEEWPPK
jgi:hypothetical protein